jgi:hypothetical protein
MIDLAAHAQAVKQAGASISNVIGVLSSWEAASESDLRLKSVAMDRLQQARLVLLDVWKLIQPQSSAVDSHNGKR